MSIIEVRNRSIQRDVVLSAMCLASALVRELACYTQFVKTLNQVSWVLEARTVAFEFATEEGIHFEA